MSLRASDVKWVVNSNNELGVEINGQYFFLYKGESLVYTDHSENANMTVRPVGKREFGEVCHPVTDQYQDREGTLMPLVSVIEGIK